MKNPEKQQGTQNRTEFEVPKPETEKTVALSVKAKRKIATETGRFYNSLMDLYLDVSTPDEQHAQAEALIEGLPGSMRKLYREGFGRFQEELRENHALLEQHRGDEVLYLIGAFMASQGISADKMEEVFKEIGKAKFIEPSLGIAIIQAEKDFFQLLKEQGVVHAEGHAVNIGADNRGEPSFFMIQRLHLEESMAEDNGLAKENRSVRHEFHHFVWNFLQRRGDYLREVEESSPGMTMAFRHFRDEVAAYTIAGRSLERINPELLTYTDDSEILKTATDARDFATICVEVARQKGVDSQDFLYASMTSRNFTELKDTFATLTPLDTVDPQSVAELYSAWADNYRAASKVAELLERKGLAIPAYLIEEYGISRMIPPQITSMNKIFSEVENLKRFAAAVKTGTIDEQGLIERVARAKLPLPKETIDIILGLTREQMGHIPLGESGEEFLKSLISIWRINEESARAAYKQIIDSSPVMRGSFNKIRDEIISRGTEEYRSEFKSGDGERKRKTESEIAERIRLLMEL